MKKTLRNLIVGTALVGGGLAVFQIGKSVLEQGEWERTRREVQLLIDTDQNRIITTDEWSPVYDYLGREANGITSTPFGGYSPSSFGYGIDLTTEQLKKYLQSRQEGETQ